MKHATSATLRTKRTMTPATTAHAVAVRALMCMCMCIGAGGSRKPGGPPGS